MRYSVIIPVYNRPDEADELLQSLTRQSFKDFEVIIVEDGSSIPCKDVAERYQNILDIRYYAKPNSGPGPNAQLRCRTQPGRIPDYTGFRLHPSRRLFCSSGRGTAKSPCRCIRRTGPCARLLYRYTESHQLLHDFVLHHRRHSRRKKENGQILSAEFQYGSASRGL